MMDDDADESLDSSSLSEDDLSRVLDVSVSRLLDNVMPSAVIVACGTATGLSAHWLPVLLVSASYLALNIVLNAHSRRFWLREQVVPGWVLFTRMGAAVLVCPAIFALAGPRANAWYVVVAPALAIALIAGSRGPYWAALSGVAMTATGYLMGLPFNTLVGICIGILTIAWVQGPVNASLRTWFLRAERAALEARKAAAAKAQFLATMSHEVRTPLNGMLGMVDLLSDTSLNSEQLEYLTNLRLSGDLLRHVVDDILDYSKIEAGKLSLNYESFSPVDWARRCVKALEPIAVDKGLTLECSVALPMPRSLAGDVQRLEQIALNLLGNAVKFTSEGRVVLAIEHRDDELYFEVRDSGIGMNQEQCTRLFQPFEQAESSTSRRFGGTGLGLAICARLTELMNGQISVDSALGQGTVFRVKIPAKPAQAPKRMRPSQARRVSEIGFRILVAEDNRVNQLVIRRQLEKRGFAVHVVENGKEALDALREEAFDLVFMDCHMPEFDGYTAVRVLRAEEREALLTRRVPVVALTADTGKDAQARCRAAGMDDFLSKPLDQEELDRVLKRWLAQASPAAEHRNDASLPEP